MKPHTRKLQQESYGMSSQSISTFHTSNSASPPPSQHHQYSNPPFESCMALTVIILLTVLFFMGFFSIYIRRFSGEPAPEFYSPPSRPARVGVGLRSKGLDPKVTKSLPVYRYYHGEAKYQNECAICLGEFEEKECVKMIPYCKHAFHLECIDTWLEMHVTCPVCRGTQFFEVNTKGGGEPLNRQLGGRSTVDNGDTCIEVGQ